MTLHQTNTGYEPKLFYKRQRLYQHFEQWVGCERSKVCSNSGFDDDDTNSHMQLPASAHFPSNNYVLVTFSRAGSDPRVKIFTVFGRYQFVQNGANPWQIQYLSHVLEVYLQFLDPKKRFSWSHNEHEKLWMISKKQLDVLWSINKDNFLLPLINMKWLRGKTLSILWQETVKHTITACRCKFGNWNMKQTRGFPRKASQALENQREILVTEVTSETLRGNKVKHTLGCNTTWQDWLRSHSNIERCSKNPQSDPMNP